MGRALASDQDIPRALKSYEAMRLPRSSRVQQQSRRQGEIYHLSGPAALARDIGLRSLGGERMLARFDWLYNARP